MTYNQLINLFRTLAGQHQQIKRFGDGEEWEINEQKNGDGTVTQIATIKPGILYPILFTIPIQSTIKENTVEWEFEFLCFGQVKKDRSNENEVQSDCQLILTDLVKILKNESTAYSLLNEPVLTPFKEKYGDYCAGFRGTFNIEVDFSNNYCDIPATGLGQGDQQMAYARIYDADTLETLYLLRPGEELAIEQLTVIRQQLGYTGKTLIQVFT